jgi:hypothetical protein
MSLAQECHRKFSHVQLLSKEERSERQAVCW